MSDNVTFEAYKPPKHLEETLVSNTASPFGIDALPSSTPEYAPAVQMFVEKVTEDPAGKGELEATSEEGSGKREAEAVGRAEKEHAVKDQGEKATDALPASMPPMPLSSPSPLEKQAYDLMVEVVSRDPRFELNHNVRQVLQEVQQLRARTTYASADPDNTDLAVIRDTVQNIWTHLQKEGMESRERGESLMPTVSPTQELINETRALVRSVNEEVNATRNNTIQLTNQVRTAMDVATRCLREMDKTAVKYEQKGEASPLLDELRSLRDMLADGFENARLEPIAPEPGETFRYNEHRPENGFAASGKIKRMLYPGFRWMQPTPPVVLLPALVETE